jgi:hypothetical protein
MLEMTWWWYAGQEEARLGWYSNLPEAFYTSPIKRETPRVVTARVVRAVIETSLRAHFDVRDAA